MVVSKELVSPAEKTVAKRVEGQPKSEAQNAIVEFFKKLVMHGDLQQSTKALEKLEKKVHWSEEDLKIIDGLKGRVEARKSEIDHGVEEVFEDVRNGNKAAAIGKARKLLRDHASDIAFARGMADRTKLEAFVDKTIDLWEQVEAAPAPQLQEKEAMEYAKLVTAANEGWFAGGVSETRFRNRVDGLEQKEVINAVRKDFAAVMRGEGDEKNKYYEEKRLRLKDVNKNSQKSVPNPSGQGTIEVNNGIEEERKKLRDKARALGVNVGHFNVRFGNGQEGKIWEMVDDRIRDWRVESPGEKPTPGEIARYQAAVRSSRDNFRQLRGWIRRAERDVEELKEEAMFEHVTKAIQNRKPRVKTAIKRGNVVVEKVGGTARERVLAVLEYMDLKSEDPKQHVKDLELIFRALNPNGDPNIDIREKDAALHIYNNAKNWMSEHGEFEQAIKNTRREVEVNMLKLRTPDEVRLMENIGIEINPRETMTDDRWEKLHSLVKPGLDVDGKPIYTAEGKSKMDWVRATFADKEKVIINGKEETMYVDNSMMADYQRRISRGVDIPQEYLMHRGQYTQSFEVQYEGYKREGFPEADAFRLAQESIHARIEELIQNIMRTQDGSREGVNQMSSWELYELFGSRFVNADTRDLWQARMGLYDVSVFVGGAEGYEDWARIASFMPKEFLWKLFDDDKLESIIEYKEGGQNKSVDLSFKGMLSALEQKVPGSKKSVRDIWMAEILGSSDMSQIDLNKRRFFLYTIGQQMGVEFEMDGKNFKVKAGYEDKAKLRMFDGSEISIMQMVGLDENGQKVTFETIKASLGGDEIRARAEWAKFEKNDRWGQYGWYVNNALMFNHLTLQSVELEKGGGKTLWKYMPNILRKLHGEAMHHYYHQKDMGMVHARDQVDSYWRSFLAWRLRKDMLAGDESTQGDLKKAVKEGGAKWKQTERKGFGGGLEEIGFDRFYYEVAYAEDLWENEEVNGSLRSVEDVRYLATAEGIQTDAYKRIVEHWRKFDKTGTFDWAPLLRVMGVEHPGSVSGEMGLRLFLQNYDKYKLMNFKGVDHSSWKDFIKYTGKSNEVFNAFIPLTEHPASDEAIAKIARMLEGYVGGQGKEAFTTKYVNWSMKMRRSRWAYETKVDRQGKERSEKWDVYERDRNGNKLTSISAEEVRRAERMGFVVNKADGMVYDKKGNLQYRAEERGWWKDFKMFRPAGWGSPMMARGMPQERWGEQKRILKKYLRNRSWTPERYAQENMRFQARLFFGCNMEKLPDNLLEAMGMTAKELVTHPWRIPGMLFTIPRGILVNLGIDEDIVTDFFSPAGKSIQKLFAS